MGCLWHRSWVCCFPFLQVAGFQSKFDDQRTPKTAGVHCKTAGLTYQGARSFAVNSGPAGPHRSGHIPTPTSSYRTHLSGPDVEWPPGPRASHRTGSRFATTTEADRAFFTTRPTGLADSPGRLATVTATRGAAWGVSGGEAAEGSQRDDRGPRGAGLLVPVKPQE